MRSSATAVLPMNEDISWRIISGQAVVGKNEFGKIVTPFAAVPQF